MLGAAHACANPLTARFGIRHGLAVALTLIQVIQWNAAVVEALYCRLSGLINGFPQGSSGSVLRLVERITELKTAAGVPVRMRECGVSAGGFSRGSISTVVVFGLDLSQHGPNVEEPSKRYDHGQGGEYRQAGDQQDCPKADPGIHA